MVFTRSKARQQATEAAEPITSESEEPHTSQVEDQGSDRSVRARRISAVRVTRFTRELKWEARVSRDAAEDETATESPEELALRALNAIKNRPKKDGIKNRPRVAVSKEEEEDKMKKQRKGKSTKVGRKKINGIETVDAEEDAMETVEGMETDESVQPDVMLLESSAKKKSIPNRSSCSGVMVTSLQPCMKEKPYFSYSSKRGVVSVSSSTGKQLGVPWGEGEEQLMKKSIITSDFEKRETAPPMYVSKAKARKVSF